MSQALESMSQALESMSQNKSSMNQTDFYEPKGMPYESNRTVYEPF
jgi:hypothetical protein